MKKLLLNIYTFLFSDRVRNNIWMYFGFMIFIFTIVFVLFLVKKYLFPTHYDGQYHYELFKNIDYSAPIGFIIVILSLLISLTLSIVSFKRRKNEIGKFYLLFSLFVLIIGCGICTVENAILGGTRF